jgi:hypothetical protein
MTSQLYLTGRLAANPEAATTRKGKLWIKLLLETEFVREPKPGEFQTESVTIPISCFAYSAELVLVVFSASKSLHGWYRVWGLTLKERAKFMRYAVSLGADPATWTRSQFVRMPDGLREENGKRQVAYFFNPQEAIKDGAS